MIGIDRHFPYISHNTVIKSQRPTQITIFQSQLFDANFKVFSSKCEYNYCYAIVHGPQDVL